MSCSGVDMGGLPNVLLSLCTGDVRWLLLGAELLLHRQPGLLLVALHLVGVGHHRRLRRRRHRVGEGHRVDDAWGGANDV